MDEPRKRIENRRQSIMITRRELGEPDLPRAAAAAGERIFQVESLSAQQWALSGRQISSLPRGQWPGRLRRLGERS